MGFFIQIAIALAAIAAIFGLIWFLYGRLLTPVRGGKNVIVDPVVTVSGGAEGLEQTIEGLIWLRKNGTLTGRIIIVDNGLDADGISLAQQAMKKHGYIVLCKMEEVNHWIAGNPLN